MVVLLGWLVATDVVGVLVCLFFDVIPFWGSSGALPYAIWFVFGAFCGIFAFTMSAEWGAVGHSAADWSEAPGARRIAAIVALTSTATILALCAWFYHIYWSRGVVGEFFVPDSAPHSIVFFVAVLGAVMLAWRGLTPAAGSTQS